MALNFDKKRDWKNRIEQKLAQRTAQIREANVRYLCRIEAEVTQAMNIEFDLPEPFQRLEGIGEEIKRLEAERETLTLALQARVIREERAYDKGTLGRVKDKLDEIADQRAAQTLNNGSLGEIFLSLETERERLTDAVLLATSNKQIQDIWAEVTGFTAGEPEVAIW